MPNIMLTYRCNLKCKYCFANEFVNKINTDITLENFKKAIDFMTKDGETYIGLIGGEPTLHRDFKEMLQLIIDNNLITQCTVYTNGILLDKFFDQLSNEKFRILVNCNSPQDIGKNLFEKIVLNLDVLFNEYKMSDKINLGINYYDDKLDCDYIISLLEKFDLHRVRLSLTVPDFDKSTDQDALIYFLERKQGLYDLLHIFDEHEILPYYDCNKPPYCIWSDEEKTWIENYVKKYGVTHSNLIGNQSICFPVIDILPTLEAVRCFGMSSFAKVHIDDFQSITDIASYFLNTIDCEAYRISSNLNCKQCYHRMTRHCTAGCIGFKSSTIKRLNDIIDLNMIKESI